MSDLQSMSPSELRAEREKLVTSYPAGHKRARRNDERVAAIDAELASRESHKLIMVLDDEETFSAVAGCSIYIVPIESDDEELAAALEEGALAPTLTFTNESAERLVEREGA